jgi:isopenicillin N synthase-like dioxygenase
MDGWQLHGSLAMDGSSFKHHFYAFILIFLPSIFSTATVMSFSHSSTIPVVDLSNAPYDETETPAMKELSRQVVDALQSSGFLLVRSPFLPLELQQKAMRATQEIFEREHEMNSTSSNFFLNDEDVADDNHRQRNHAALPLSQAEFSRGGIVKHPTDPKAYLMLDCHSRETLEDDLPPTATAQNVQILGEYAEALETVKVQLLECIAVGLELPQKQYLVDLHQTRNSVLRLLHYYKVDGHDAENGDKHHDMDIEDLTGKGLLDEAKASCAEPTIRCKAHSDYGSITLLLIDGTPGLQAFVHGEWVPVPHVPGALTVNIGSLLSEWSQGKLLATLHRVVGDDGDGQNHGKKARTSMAYFADPDPDISTKLNKTGKEKYSTSKTKFISVADYIQYRSGGSGSNREGVQFTAQERGRLEGSSSGHKLATGSSNVTHRTNGSQKKKSDELKPPEPEPPEVVLAAWKAALEVFVHELLYTRKVYPRDSFCKSRFLGTQCHLCRNPGVVSYINDALEVIVPALISEGNSQELVLEIYDQVNMEVFEEYYISFAAHAKRHNGSILQFTAHSLEEVEQEMRDLICSVGTVARCAPTHWPGSVSFKLLLQGIGSIDISKKKTSQLRKAMEEGKWYRASRPDDRESNSKKRRPIYDIPNTGCSFQYQLLQWTEQSCQQEH